MQATNASASVEVVRGGIGASVSEAPVTHHQLVSVIAARWQIDESTVSDMGREYSKGGV